MAGKGLHGPYAGHNGTPTLARREGGVMDRPENGPTIFDRHSRGRAAAVAYAIRLLLVIFSGLTYWAISTLPAGADIEHANGAGFHGEGASFHFQDPDLAVLRDYAQQIAAQDSRSEQASRSCGWQRPTVPSRRCVNSCERERNPRIRLRQIRPVRRPGRRPAAPAPRQVHRRQVHQRPQHRRCTGDRRSTRIFSAQIRVCPAMRPRQLRSRRR